MNSKNLINRLKTSMFVTATFVMLLISCGDDEKLVVELPSLIVTPATLVLSPKEKGTVGANVAPVTWSSSAASVVSVDASSGEVAALALGTAIITASGPNGETSTCNVTVTPVVITEITVIPTTATVWVDSTLQLTAEPTPYDIPEFNPVWSSSDESVVTVSQTGLITGVSIGTATVTATVDNISDNTAVTVLSTMPFASWSFEDETNLAKANVDRGVEGIPLGLFGDITPVEGPSPTNKAVRIETGRDNYLKVFHGMLPEGADFVADWTVMVVFRMPDSTGWHTILQTDITPAGDADFFVHYNGTIGTGTFGYSGPALKIGEWYRLIMSRHNGLFNSYVNGVRYHNNVNGSNSRFNMLEAFLISQDNDGEDRTIDIAEIAVWKEPMNATQINLIETEHQNK